MSALIERLPDLLVIARRLSVDGWDWPGWSTGETLAVALVLNRFEVLEHEGYTMAEAFDRLAGELSVDQILNIARGL